MIKDKHVADGTDRVICKGTMTKWPAQKHLKLAQQNARCGE